MFINNFRFDINYEDSPISFSPIVCRLIDFMPMRTCKEDIVKFQAS